MKFKLTVPLKDSIMLEFDSTSDLNPSPRLILMKALAESVSSNLKVTISDNILIVECDGISRTIKILFAMEESTIEEKDAHITVIGNYVFSDDGCSVSFESKSFHFNHGNHDLFPIDIGISMNTYSLLNRIFNNHLSIDQE